MAKINCALVCLQVDKKIIEFVNIVNKCKLKQIARLYLQFNDDKKSIGNISEENMIRKKLKFVSNAYKIGNHIDSNIALHFLLQNPHPMQEQLIKNAVWNFNDLVDDCQFDVKDNSNYVYIPTYSEKALDDSSAIVAPIMTSKYESISVPSLRDHVVLGGTFDRLHNGHFYLLTTACLLAKKGVGVGVTNNEMLKNKLLFEIIESVDVRMLNVYNYLKTCSPNLQIRTDRLNDSVGFSGTVADFQTIIVSEETEDGIQAVNDVRKKNGLNTLNNFVIEVLNYPKDDKNKVEDKHDALDKLSSSINRFNELGYLRRPVVKQFVEYPYIIGVSGNICSGKSSVCRRLAKRGAYLINCDLEAHKCYLPNTEEYNQLVSTFGERIVESNKGSEYAGFINRKVLGEIVFSNYEDMEKLTAIIWPKMKERVFNLIKDLEGKDVKICVIEAAVLFESNMQDLMHEVWYIPVAPKESIKRLMDRNSLSFEEASKRVNFQAKLISSTDKVNQSNVILSTAFPPEVTDKLVERAWQNLQNRLQFDRNVS